MAGNRYSPEIERTVACLASGFLLAVGAWAQSTGAIRGLVSDPTQAVIPGARITAVNQETGVEYRATSNGTGSYLLQALPPGIYQVLCSSEGMAVSERPDIRVQVAQTLRIDFQLKVGTATEVVEVSAAAQLLQSEKTDVGQVIEGERILDMPLNGRNYLELARFTAGVLPSRHMGKGTRHDGREGGEGGFLAAGMHAAQNNVLLDGADNSSRNSGGALGFQSQAVKPPVDAVSEFKVITQNTAAEYGYRTGAKVVVSTRSGTNELHGSGYWFLRNDKLDATNFFANRSGAAKPTLKRNQFGGTLGGPIIRNRMFLFGSYQGTRVRLGKSFTSWVPSIEVKNGYNFSNQPDPNRMVFDPLTFNPETGKRTAFPNFTIPQDRIDPVTQQVIAFYPDPNIAGRENLPNNFFYSPVATQNWDQFDFRWDWNLTDTHRWFVRYSIRNDDTYEPGPLPFPAMGAGGQTVRLDGDNVASALTSTLSPTVFNELRFGYTHFPTKFDIPFEENWNTRLGIPGAPGDKLNDGNDHGYSTFYLGPFSNLGPVAFWPNDNSLYNWMVADHLTLLKGRHTLKLGGELRHALVERLAGRSRRGGMLFNGVYTAEEPDNPFSRSRTGSSMADFLLGWASNHRWGSPLGENHVAQYWAGFVQDDWKITPRLTMNLGVRWELFHPATYPDPDRQTVARLLTGINGSQYAYTPEQKAWGAEEWRPLMEFPSDGDDCGCSPNWKNFAPRLGLAYRANNKTVIRAGGGLYYGEADHTAGQAARFTTGAPRAVELTAPQGRVFTDKYVAEGYAPIPEGAWPSNTRVSTTFDRYEDMYAAQWFFDIQRELPGDTLFTVGYNGTSTSFIPATIEVNRPQTPHPTIRWQQRRRYDFFADVTRRVPMLNSNYNALTVKAEKRFSGGLTFISSYTWSHNIDYANESLQHGGSSQLFTWDQSHDRGNSSLDRRHAWVTSFLYELPFGRGKRFAGSGGPLSYVVGGWQIGGIVSLLAGTWDHHTINADTTNVGGASRGNLLRNPNLPRSERTIDRWFDTEAVGPGNLGELDNAGRNILEGPGIKNLNMIVSRDFRLPLEGHRLQFRFESFNFTNTPQWGRPNRSFGTAAVGTIREADEPRRIQFGLKYVF